MAGIFPHHSRKISGGRILHFFEPCRKFLLGECDVQSPLCDVEGNDIAVLHGTDRAAFDSFRRHMSCHQTMRRSGKPPIGEECDRIAKSCPDDGGGHAQHFSHARATGRPFVPNDDHIAGFDLSGLHGHEGIFFAIKHLGGPSEIHDGMAGDFDHASFRREIAFENDHASRRLDRM